MKGLLATYAYRLALMLALAAFAVALACAGCAPAGEADPEQQSATSATPQAEEPETATTVVEESPGQRTPDSVDPADRAAPQPAPENPPAEPTQNQRVVLGNEQFDAYLPLLAGKRVALFSNQSGVVGDAVSPAAPAIGEPGADLVPFGLAADGSPLAYGQHILEALLERGVNVVVAFAPEHGFRGSEDAGAEVADSVDEATGVPVRSLYGGAQLSADDTAAFDTLVVDLQDVGLRYYTYYLTLYHLMDACAAAGKEVVVLDRPNPNGFYVDGPILRSDCASGVGELPIPVVHGMTWGELAQMINGEGWLGAGPGACSLTVIPCQNYTHQTKSALVSRPSPNLKDMRAIYLYASTCFFENTAVSVGRGTEFPFEAYGSPYFEGVEGCSFTFVPQSIPGATQPPFLGQPCYGVDLRTVPLESIWQEGINLEYLVSAYHALQAAHPEVSFFGETTDGQHYWIDLLMGTTDVRTQIEAGWPADQIEAAWAPDVEAFKQQRAPYLLYPE